MTIWNLGSINADHFYQLPHIPRPGETIACHQLETGLGGKGANMSVAASRAAAHVAHIGAIGKDGIWARDRLLEYGVDTRHVHTVDGPTGHAIIAVADDGENAIIIYPGANNAITEKMIGAALSEAQTGDTVLFQNETPKQRFAAETGSKCGLRVAYAAAPFDAEKAESVLPYLDFLIVNRVEADQLRSATGQGPADLGINDVIVTLGADGCDWIRGGDTRHFEARAVSPVDTTGAGDTFTGYVLAGLDRGMPMEQAIDLATKASALMVTRHGTADAIPDLLEVQKL